MRFAINARLCQGHGLCYAAAPDQFDADDDGHGVVIGELTEERALADAREIIQLCPEHAISVKKD
jgi:ferredoxin